MQARRTRTRIDDGLPACGNKSIAGNRKLREEIATVLVKTVPIILGVNKRNELIRLLYELCQAHERSAQKVLEQVGIQEIVAEGAGGLFHRLKDRLLKLRYPSIGRDNKPRIVPVEIDSQGRECAPGDSAVAPKRIFVEQSVRNLEWTRDFVRHFPDAEIIPVVHLRDGMNCLRQHPPISSYAARRENIFVIRNKSSFIKACPCSMGVRRCGYWILNVGFGCSMDCSYCYLQTYSNASGLILPANLEEYLSHLENFDRRLSRRTRIGTGEFTDSLYLDQYTGYSSFLIPFFRKTKNLVLELKTKADDIETLLQKRPHKNVVISWSMNPPQIAERYEMGAVSVGDRIKSAVEVARKGYQVGFHFDPIVFYPSWKEDYRTLVEEIFSRDELRRMTVWVSLGTLRYTSGLQQIAEQRFADNRLFYWGEFYVGRDGKLRYPPELRIELYNAMIQWIRSFDISGWIYLCMEFPEVWSKTMLTRDTF
ncbi:MAG: hypothetical protein JXD19_08585 [Deltaproteobacteria bacterium]|nr:hypothetical protein [Deltaproteobacteria bacterium]